MHSPDLMWTTIAPEHDAWSGGFVRTETLRTDCQIAIIGAGPYGLSAAAHLKAARIRPLIFGEAMGFWRRHMPKGMLLRSPWRGNHIADPENRLTLDHFAAETRTRTADPVPVETFIRYGEWVQRSAAPQLDRRQVVAVIPAGKAFRLTLADGESVHVARVVVATGLERQELRPAQFDDLPADMVSHSTDHTSLMEFRGKRVTVVGRGQTALEFAVLLHENGANVELISRGGVDWTGSETPGGGAGLRGAALRHLRPASPIGPFPINWVIQEPGIYRRLPDFVRNRISAGSLKPTAASWLRPRSQAVRMNLGRTIDSVRYTGRAAQLRLDNGAVSECEHVLLATGFRADIGAQRLIAPELMDRIQQEDGSPVLNGLAESSVPGLHFIGSSAIYTFGPVMRSIYGAGAAARAVTRAAARK